MLPIVSKPPPTSVRAENAMWASRSWTRCCGTHGLGGDMEDDMITDTDKCGCSWSVRFAIFSRFAKYTAYCKIHYPENYCSNRPWEDFRIVSTFRRISNTPKMERIILQFLNGVRVLEHQIYEVIGICQKHCVSLLVLRRTNGPATNAFIWALITLARSISGLRKQNNSRLSPILYPYVIVF